LSKKDRFIFVTEVKNIVNHHQLQTAIGQLILYKFRYKRIDYNEIVYQMVFPKKYREYRYFSQDFSEYLDKENGIKIIFVESLARRV